jgi:hypothetical protein
MRKIVFTILFTIGAIALGYSQDVINGTNGEKIKAKVLEINSSEIKYKRFDNPDGPTYTILKSEVQSIQYPNGASDVFSKQENSNEIKTVSNSKIETAKPNNQTNIFGYWQARPGAIFTAYYYIYSDGEKISVKKYDLKSQLNTTNFAKFSLTPRINPDGTTEANVFVFDNLEYHFKNDSILDVIRTKPRQKFTFVRITKSELAALNLTDENRHNDSSKSTSEIVAPKRDNDLKVEGLIGKVKDYTIYKYVSANTSDINNLILQSKLNSKFNEYGYFTEMTLFNANDKLDNKALFSYDQNNNLILKTYYNGDNEKIATSEYVYNNAGLMTESKELDAQGNVYSRSEYKYNAMGKVIEELVFAENNTFFGKKTTIYDDKGNVTSQYSSDANGNPVEQFSYAYDKKSRLTRIDAYTNNQFNYAFDYEYNSEDEISLKRQYANSPSHYNDMIEIKYDKHGNPVSEFSLMTMEKTKRSIEYDSQGNMVKIIAITTNQIPIVEKREYLYY